MLIGQKLNFKKKKFKLIKTWYYKVIKNWLYIATFHFFKVGQIYGYYGGIASS